MSHVTDHEKELFLGARRDAFKWQVFGMSAWQWAWPL